jgi:hypothetical protein
MQARSRPPPKVIQTTDTAGPRIALRWFAVYTVKEPRPYQLTSTFKF